VPVIILYLSVVKYYCECFAVCSAEANGVQVSLPWWLSAVDNMAHVGLLRVF